MPKNEIATEPNDQAPRSVGRGACTWWDNEEHMRRVVRAVLHRLRMSALHKVRLRQEIQDGAQIRSRGSPVPSCARRRRGGKRRIGNCRVRRQRRRECGRGRGERHRRYGRLGIRSRRKRHVLGCGRRVERRRADRVVRCGQGDRRGCERGRRNRRRRRNGFGPGGVVPCIRRGVDRRGRHQRHQGELVLRAPPQGAHQGVP